jgi:Beta-propeller repeat/Abnormal spindle-like microcephaly-assoc'd, ASPM-SPD-2-Hydin
MNRTLLALGVACLAVGGFVAAGHRRADSKSPAKLVAPDQNATARRQAILSAYGKLPLYFETNMGQTDPRVNYLGRGNGYTVFLASTDATVLLSVPSAERSTSSARPAAAPAHPNSSNDRSAVIRLALAGSNRHAEAESLDLQPGSSNYLIGNDVGKWHRNISHFARVKYHDVYPGVDLLYYGNQGQLESDYVVAPGADPSQIGMRIEGAGKLRLNSEGDLVVSTKAGDVVLHRPRVYQRREGSQTPQEVAANYVRRGPYTVGIDLASYDTTQPLIIDPVLSYSTYLGGSANQVIRGIAVDSSGFAYVTGSTSSANFPVVTGSFQTTLSNTKSNAFITKLKQDGTGLVYSTFLGGTGAIGDSANAIAIDATGDVYIVGFSSSTDFPRSPSAYQTNNSGGGGFFSKLDPTGATLLYSTYLNGSGIDRLNAVAVDLNGAAYITGSTTSTNFPIVPATALQNTNNVSGSQIGTAFLSKIDPTLSGTNSLTYSTYLGGSKEDAGLGVAVSAFNAYIVGTTSSSDFPQPATKNGFQQTLKNTIGGNAFLARIDTTQPATLVYSTYLGGSPNGQGSNPGDVADAVAVPVAGGDAYITGYTYATDFPTVSPLDTASNTPFQKTIIARIDTTKSGAASLIFSTYFGGTVFTLGGTTHGADLGFGVALDSAKNIYVAGTTSSADFPVTPGAPQPTKVGAQNAFLSEISATGASVLFSTYLGGSNDAAAGVALDGASPANAYIAGPTSGNFPTTIGAFQTANLSSGANNNNSFVAKLSPGAVTGVFASPAVLSFGNQIVNTPSAAKIVTLFNNSSSTLSNIAISFTGTNATDFTQGVSTCSTTLAANTNCTIGVIFTPTTTSAETAALSISDNDPNSPQIVTLSGTGTTAPAAVFVAPTTLSFGNQVINTTSPPQTVTLTNNSTSTLTGIAVSIVGTAATSFAQTTTCTATLPAGATCTISVTFTPTVAAAATATLSVADSDPSSPQTVSLSGTGISSNPDFSVAVAPTTASVAAGGTTNVTVTVTGLNGFTTPVALTCTGAPLGSTCTLTPANVTPTSTGATSMGAIVTTARTPATATTFPRGPRYPNAAWPILCVLLLLAIWIARRQPVKTFACAFALLLAVSLTSCSGLPNHGTPAGLYTLTITGTAGTQTHQVTVSLTVT